MEAKLDLILTEIEKMNVKFTSKIEAVDVNVSGNTDAIGAIDDKVTRNTDAIGVIDDKVTRNTDAIGAVNEKTTSGIEELNVKITEVEAKMATQESMDRLTNKVDAIAEQAATTAEDVTAIKEHQKAIVNVVSQNRWY